MELRIAMDEKMMDVRLRDRLLAEGKITKSQVDEYLKNLDDQTGNFESVKDEPSQEAVTE
ncbi:MAG: hypothetical protein N4A33_03995 [Bacteriovoracaceae bacterium]|jgi:hypothetical protein|nr:hypothetical protein [Bacteriovoracaceae bacterium]